MKRSTYSLLLGLATIGVAAHAQRTPSAPALRQSFDITIPQAPMPVPVEGKVQLAYELHLTNFSAEPLSVKRVRIADPNGKIEEFAGDALDQRLAMVSGGSKSAITPGQRAIFFVEIGLRDIVLRMQ